MVALPLRSCARQLGRVAAFAAGVLLAFGPSLPVLLALRPRGHLHRRDHARAARGRVPLPRPPAPLAPGGDRRAARAQLRDQGDDVHHRSSWPARSSCRARCWREPAAAARGAARARGRVASAGRPGRGRSPRSPASSRSCSRRSSPTRAGSGTALYDGPRLLARPARRRPRRRAAGTSTSSCCSRDEWPVLLLGAVGAVVAFRRPTLLRAVPGLGLRALAGRLLVGGREVRLARAAPAAAADPARRRSACRRSGTRAARLARQGRPRGRRRSALAYVGLRLVVGQRRPPRRPARVPRLHPVLRRGQAGRRRGRARWPTAAARQAVTITVDSAEGATFP